jgi:hypothetical protein
MYICMHTCEVSMFYPLKSAVVGMCVCYKCILGVQKNLCMYVCDMCVCVCVCVCVYYHIYIYIYIYIYIHIHINMYMHTCMHIFHQNGIDIVTVMAHMPCLNTRILDKRLHARFLLLLTTVIFGKTVTYPCLATTYR